MFVYGVGSPFCELRLDAWMFVVETGRFLGVGYEVA